MNPFTYCVTIQIKDTCMLLYRYLSGQYTFLWPRLMTDNKNTQHKIINSSTRTFLSDEIQENIMRRTRPINWRKTEGFKWDKSSLELLDSDWYLNISRESA